MPLALLEIPLPHGQGRAGVRGGRRADARGARRTGPGAGEPLRFASGDEDLRAALYEEFGEDLLTKFAKIIAALEKQLGEWSGDEDEGDEGASARKGLPEKKKKKLLDPKTWERDGRLVETATKLRELLGDKIFEDHNVFRDRVDEVLKKAGIKLGAADLKQILKVVSWRVEAAPPVIAKTHKPGKAKADPLRGLFGATVDSKPAIVEYEPDSDLRDTEQVPLLEEGGIEAFVENESFRRFVGEMVYTLTR